MTEIPKTIFGYWHQGRDAAPAAIKDCWRLWTAMNPGWRLEILEWGDVSDRILGAGVQADTMSFMGLSNIVRLASLAERGGVWVDAYTVPLVPLDTWLPSLTEAGFFAYHDPYRRRLAETWFIASAPGHPLSVNWHAYMVEYWRKIRRPMRFPRELDSDFKGAFARGIGAIADRLVPAPSARGRKRIFEPKDLAWSVSAQGGGQYAISPYFAAAYLFNLMLDENPDLFEAWRQYPKVTSYDTLLLRHWKRDYARLTPLDVRRMSAGKVMQKLNLKGPLPEPLMRELLGMAESAIPG